MTGCGGAAEGIVLFDEAAGLWELVPWRAGCLEATLACLWAVRSLAAETGGTWRVACGPVPPQPVSAAQAAVVISNARLITLPVFVDLQCGPRCFSHCCHGSLIVCPP